MPAAAKEHLPEMEKGLATNVQKDLDWLEYELTHDHDWLTERSDWLVGDDDVTAADIMMGFTTEFILTRKLGTEGGNWPNVTRWLEMVKEREAYKKAVERTGYSL